MSLVVGTHSGTFHADDVLAVALVRTFVDPFARVIRTRDKAQLSGCDIVVDVGGEYDPDRRRFDHHQATYAGPMSSAGMVLAWLVSKRVLTDEFGALLRDRVVDYIDAVDTGRRAPDLDVPCFARIVEAIGQGCDSPDEQLAAFERCVGIGCELIRGLEAGHARMVAARDVVRRAMEDAVVAGRSVLLLDRYVPWKPVYFAMGGEHHPTDYVLFPSEDATWKLVAIPPTQGQFEQKRPLPKSWAGLMGSDLEAATEVPGSIFCHKNRFIAVFASREGAIEALKRFDLYHLRPEAVRRAQQEGVIQTDAIA